MRLYGIGFALIAIRKILISMTCDYSYLSKKSLIKDEEEKIEK
jgi:hypothetical protein